MNSILMLISALLPFAITELEQYKVLSPTIGGLITGVEGAAAAFTKDVTTNSGTLSITATGLLAGISAAVQVLAQQTDISPTTLSIINALDKAITAGLAASQVTNVDPTKLQPIAPIV